MNHEIIIAHYNEDIEWLKPYAKNVIIYHKGNESTPRFPVKKWVKLENVWREWHTYLYHIINNYNNLADINIFLQGNIEDHKEEWIVFNNIIDYIKEVQKKWFSTKKLELLVKKSPQINYIWKFKEMLENWKMVKSELSFQNFYKDIFSKNQPLVDIVFYWWCFWVNKNKILNREIKFYKKIMNYMDKTSNPEEWHYLERLWYNVFNSFNIIDYIKAIKFTLIWTYNFRFKKNIKWIK